MQVARCSGIRVEEQPSIFWSSTSVRAKVRLAEHIQGNILPECGFELKYFAFAVPGHRLALNVCQEYSNNYIIVTTLQQLFHVFIPFNCISFVFAS